MAASLESFREGMRHKGWGTECLDATGDKNPLISFTTQV